MRLTYYVREEYGHRRRFPASETLAEALALLTGRENPTIREQDERALALLGYELEEVEAP